MAFSIYKTWPCGNWPHISDLKDSAINYLLTPMDGSPPQTSRDLIVLEAQYTTTNENFHIETRGKEESRVQRIFQIPLEYNE